MTPTWAPGNSPRQRSAGFSLLELMVVLLLVALATALTTLAMRDSAQSKLEEEGVRLSALLESARTLSRIVGTEVRWEPARDGGFRFVGLPATSATSLPTHWLDAETRAQVLGEPQLRLGPEPLLFAQRVVLRLGAYRVAVGTDGLSPFGIVESATADPADAATATAAP